MATPDTSELTTAQLVERTGVAAPTLRMWETRHGFPSPARLPGGHRRYSARDVERVLSVVRARQEGLSLGAAIRRALADTATQSSSIFTGLAPDSSALAPMTLAKPELIALSRAIEDEHIARGGGGVLVGSFQQPRFYRQSERRWRELGRTAALAVVLADFRALRQVPGRPVEVPIGQGSPLEREWAIVFHSPRASACLSAWEVTQVRQPRERERRFEVIWSPEAQVAHRAIVAAAQAIEPVAPAVSRGLIAALAPAPESTQELRAAVGQAHRMLEYMAEATRREHQ